MPIKSHTIPESVTATFRHISNVKQLLQQSTKRILFLISVKQPYHEQRELMAQINLFEILIQGCVREIERKSDSAASAGVDTHLLRGDWEINIVVADTLQAYNHSTRESLYTIQAEWARYGREYVARNQENFQRLVRAGYSESGEPLINVNLQFNHWEALLTSTADEFERHYSSLLTAYRQAEPPALREAVNDKGFHYLARNGGIDAAADGKAVETIPELPEGNLRYIIEELVVLYKLAAEGTLFRRDRNAPLFIIYPSAEENAFLEARKFFGTSELINWLGLSLHQERLSLEPALVGEVEPQPLEKMQRQYEWVRRTALGLMQVDSHSPLQFPTFSPDMTCIKREKYLDALDELFTTHSRVSLYGMGGMGKSHLAVNYVQHATNKYNLKIWSTQKGLYGTFRALGASLGLVAEGDKAKAIVAKVIGYLELQPGWVLVVDDVQQANAIQQFLPKAGGHILLTTRQKGLALPQFEELEVAEMEDAEAKVLLSAKIDKEDNRYPVLAGRLGNLPLALEQAGAYIKKHQVTVDVYLEALSQHDFEALFGTQTLPGDAISNKAVAATFLTSIYAVKRQNKGNELIVDNVLQVCALLSHSRIRQTILQNWYASQYPEKFESDPGLISKLVEQLGEHSLIRGTDYIDIHPVVQDVVRMLAAAQKLPIDDLVQLLINNISVEMQLGFYSNLEYAGGILEHLLALREYTHSVTSLRISMALIDKLLGQIYRGFNDIRAVEYFKNALSVLLPVMGAESTLVLALSLDIIFCQIDFGDKASALSEIAVLADEGLLNEELLDRAKGLTTQLIRLRSAISYFYYRIGQPTEALRFREAAVVLSEKYFDADDPLVLSEKLELASLYLALNQTIQAKKVLLGIYELAKHSPIHPHTQAQILIGLGRTFNVLKQFGTAIYFLEAAFAIFVETDSQQQHQILIDIHHNLGQARMNLGYVKRAFVEYQLAKELIYKYGLHHDPRYRAFFSEFTQLSIFCGGSVSMFPEDSPPLVIRLSELAPCDAEEVAKEFFGNIMLAIATGNSQKAFGFMHACENICLRTCNPNYLNHIGLLKKIARLTETSSAIGRLALSMARESAVPDLDLNDDEPLAVAADFEAKPGGRISLGVDVPLSDSVEDRIQGKQEPISSLYSFAKLRQRLIGFQFFSLWQSYRMMCVHKLLRQIDGSSSDISARDLSKIAEALEFTPVVLDEFNPLELPASFVQSRRHLFSSEVLGQLAANLRVKRQKDVEQFERYLNSSESKACVYSMPPVQQLLPPEKFSPVIVESEQPVASTEIYVQCQEPSFLGLLQLVGGDEMIKHALVSAGGVFGYILSRFIDKALGGRKPSPTMEVRYRDKATPYGFSITLTDFALSTALNYFCQDCRLSLYASGLSPEFKITEITSNVPRNREQLEVGSSHIKSKFGSSLMFLNYKAGDRVVTAHAAEQIDNERLQAEFLTRSNVKPQLL